MEQLRMDKEFARRYVNDGFSGGEMKRAEILQLAMLRPKFAILDETDSGLDVDAVRLASQSIADIGGKHMGILIITHHEHLLEHNRPDLTHVMLGGRIVETGGPELAVELHKKGYDRIRAAYPEEAAADAAMKKREPAAAAG
jgi:Fe-S cluster assembly ATP-binding protein